MKKLILLCSLALCLLILLPACSSPTPEAPGAAPAPSVPVPEPAPAETEHSEPEPTKPAAEDQEEIVENVIRDFYDAYNEGQVIRCTSYLTNITEDQKMEVEAALGMALKLTGESEINDVEVTSLNADSATVDVSLKIGGETKSKTWQMIKEGPDWKLVWEQEASSEPEPEPTPEPIPEPTIAEAGEAFADFLYYYKYRQWDKLWATLHPDMQAIYEGISDFADDMELRIPVSDYATGPMQEVEEWNCESTEGLIGTDITYYDPIEIPTTFFSTSPAGNIEHSQMMYAVNSENEWKFFIRKIRPTTTGDEAGDTSTETGYSRDNPVPKGFKFVTPDEIEVTAQVAKRGNTAWIIIRKANSFNDYPPDGMEYVILSLRIKNVSTKDEPWRFSKSNCSLVGSMNKVYHTSDKIIVLPDEGDYMALKAELFPGGQATGCIAFCVDKKDVDLIMMWESLLRDTVYFQVGDY